MNLSIPFFPHFEFVFQEREGAEGVGGNRGKIRGRSQPDTHRI